MVHEFKQIGVVGAGTMGRGIAPRPGELLERLVGEGKLGRKSGEGFYRYE